MNRGPVEAQVPDDPVRLEGFGEPVGEPVGDPSGKRHLYQRREKIFTRFVGGFFQRLRFFTGWPLLAGYFLLPWIQWDARQAVWFDLPNRLFHMFGVTFWPQDLWLLGWLLIIGAFALFTFTTLVGRIWCGYTCPQTVWTAIFMWIEQFAEGERHQRIRLEQAPWFFSKMRKRAAKHGMWLAVALLTGITFVGYFTPVRELVLELARLETGGWQIFWVLFFTGATYLNAGWMREQVCIYMCPYARFQSAMFDEDTLIVSYDAGRGEPRGARKREATPIDLGDCIDCTLCVQVCPTGIDIRDGLQYQCIGCAHCIDACNQVMGRMGYAPGLIRYTTERALAGGRSHWLRPRAIGYGAALTVMAIVFSYALLNRNLLEVDVLRERGELYEHLDAATIGNQYRLRLLNKTQSDMTIEVTAVSELPVALSLDGPVALSPGEIIDLPLRISAPAAALTRQSATVTIQACALEQGRCDREDTRFLGPASIPTGGGR
jgi:cytochrome c oxidase accessory protein FixG